jgi:hypothetical protein
MTKISRHNNNGKKCEEGASISLLGVFYVYFYTQGEINYDVRVGINHNFPTTKKGSKNNNRWRSSSSRVGR